MVHNKKARLPKKVSQKWMKFTEILNNKILIWKKYIWNTKICQKYFNNKGFPPSIHHTIKHYITSLLFTSITHTLFLPVFCILYDFNDVCVLFMTNLNWLDIFNHLSLFWIRINSLMIVKRSDRVFFEKR